MNETTWNEQFISISLIAVMAGTRFPVAEKREIVRRRGPVSNRIFRNDPLSNWTREPTRRLSRVRERLVHAFYRSFSKRPVLSFTLSFPSLPLSREEDSKLSVPVNRMPEHIWPVETRELRVKYKLWGATPSRRGGEHP